MDSVADLLLSGGVSPVAIATLIVLATFVLEDAAIAGAAVLAAMGLIDHHIALAALIFGIFVGDLGLYGLGVAARRLEWARRFAENPRVARSARWLKMRAGRTLILARFLPGFRLPIYVASGVLDVSLPLFAAVTLGAGLIWTVAIFEIIVLLGQAEADVTKAVAYSSAILFLVAGYLVPKLAERFLPTRVAK